MGTERVVEKNYTMKLIDITAERVIEKDRVDIKKILLSNESLKELSNQDLRSLFSYWSKYIPQHKQSPSCQGCRNAVYNFWYKVKQHWEKE
tara:strand:- start:238 stop:510 length:273 start_codon:yes stop_codon:yes gene_type:complete